MIWILFMLALGDVPDVRVQMIGSKTYICFDEVAGKDLLELRLIVPVLDEKVKLLEKQSAVKDAQIVKWQAAYQDLTDQNAILVKDSATQRQEIEESRTWLRSAVVWGITGVALGIIAGGSAVYLIEKAR